MRREFALAVAAFMLAGAAHAALPEGIAGPWYNPAQSGHGLSITLADRATRGVVLWHVFDPEGAPLTLYVDAAVEGRDLVGPAYAPRGMRFGEFDPADVDLPAWGRVRIAFDDCQRATLSWEANDPAYAGGSTPIERLARVDSLPCTLPPPTDIPVGLRVLSLQGARAGDYDAGLGIVDGEGRLWGLSAMQQDNALVLAEIPGPTFVSSLQPQIYLGTPLRVRDDGGVDVRLTALAPNWAWRRGERRDVEGVWEEGGGGEGRFPASGDAAGGALTWVPAPASLARLVAPIDAASLAGRYRFPLRGQFFSFSNDLRIDAEGNAELADHVGHVSASEGDQGLVDFQLRSRTRPWLRPYVGRGWIDESALGRRLVLVGDNGSNGFALVATREEASR